MEKPRLKQILLLVFPLWNGSKELKTPSGKRKFEQWIKQIEAAGKRKDSAVVVFHDSRHPFKGELHKTLLSALEKNLPGAFLFTTSTHGLWEFTATLESKFSFEKTLKIVRFGQHANNCVDAVGLEATKVIRNALRAVNKKPTIIASSANGLSIKLPTEYLRGLIEKNQQNLTPRQRVLDADAKINLLKMLKKKRTFTPSQIAHVIKPSSTTRINQRLKTRRH
ncbi:MAG: hypothetical protein WCW44_03745 [archaeon]|jgi:hypothetical protein